MIIVTSDSLEAHRLRQLMEDLNFMTHPNVGLTAAATAADFLELARRPFTTLTELYHYVLNEKLRGTSQLLRINAGLCNFLKQMPNGSNMGFIPSLNVRNLRLDLIDEGDSYHRQNHRHTTSIIPLTFRRNLCRSPHSPSKSQKSRRSTARQNSSMLRVDQSISSSSSYRSGWLRTRSSCTRITSTESSSYSSSSEEPPSRLTFSLSRVLACSRSSSGSSSSGEAEEGKQTMLRDVEEVSEISQIQQLSSQSDNHDDCEGGGGGAGKCVNEEEEVEKNDDGLDDVKKEVMLDDDSDDQTSTVDEVNQKFVTSKFCENFREVSLSFNTLPTPHRLLPSLPSVLFSSYDLLQSSSSSSSSAATNFSSKKRNNSDF